ncbi:MAG: formimidoylglutamate deiminase [Microbacteriaceae bacterium]
MTIWAERALLRTGAGVDFIDGVRIETDADGRVADIRTGVAPEVVDTPEIVVAPGASDTPDAPGIRLGLVVPGFGNAHSHAFHRTLRGQTHDGTGDFWVWREAMYRAAGRLNPDSYRLVATAVFGEMVRCGYTAVGEFHYLHHQPDGTPYRPRHSMELALVDAAEAVGIRLVLLDTCYLAGGIGRGLQPGQRRFSDLSAGAWLDRWHALREAIAGRRRVTLGAAIHSVRAVPREALAEIARELPGDVPLHIHLSEQPQENADCVAAYGCTPTALLERLGLLGERLTAVHATHLSDDDVRMLGEAHAGIVICPSTEADLGDGIGPARRLAEAGARLSIGSDQNAVIDPLLELRGLEYGERLATGTRGRFSPSQLWEIGTAGGYRALGLGGRATGLAVGDLCDLVELDPGSLRTAGATPAQLPMVATASDVMNVLIGGQIVRSGTEPETQEAP